MTKTEEYQNALNYITSEVFTGGNSILETEAEIIKKLLQPLIDQTKVLTLEEVKKMWEEEGFEIISCSKERFEVYKQWIERHQRVSHHTSAKVVIEKDFFYIVGQFSNKYTHLLTKTLKALEGKNEQ